jgi:hypothetical protein
MVAGAFYDLTSQATGTKEPRPETSQTFRCESLFSQCWGWEDCSAISPETSHLFAGRPRRRRVLHSAGKGEAECALQARQGSNDCAARCWRFLGRGIHRLGSTPPAGNRHCDHGVLDLEDRKEPHGPHAPRATRVLGHVCWVVVERHNRTQADLVDQLFNSSEKRLARALLILSRVGKEVKTETVVPRVSQETLAEMVGTTRSRVNFFMNRFRKLGFIDYNGGLEVNSSLLTVVLHE